MMPYNIKPGDPVNVKPEVSTQSSSSETAHSTTCSQNIGIFCSFSLDYYFLCLVNLSSLLYIGRMYHVEKKETGHWKTIYSVVRDLNVLKKVY